MDSILLVFHNAFIQLLLLRSCLPLLKTPIHLWAILAEEQSTDSIAISWGWPQGMDLGQYSFIIRHAKPLKQMNQTQSMKQHDRYWKTWHPELCTAYLRGDCWTNGLPEHCSDCRNLHQWVPHTGTQHERHHHPHCHNQLSIYSNYSPSNINTISQQLPMSSNQAEVTPEELQWVLPSTNDQHHTDSKLCFCRALSCSSVKCHHNQHNSSGSALGQSPTGTSRDTHTWVETSSCTSAPN